ncbi:CNP1-like family protein [Ramlibacter sp. MAHUQ-53]|uniref:CNP1-like family protein n=1 Tax=unclassified Ramlibacter TaxID=2617605 RepID=UPI0036389CB2
MLRKAALLLALGGCTLAGAQGYDPVTGLPRPNENAAERPDWREEATALPQGLRTEGLVPVEVRTSELRFGVDPASIVVGGDGVIRYVVVATSASGAVNAMQEGVRCIPGEAKVYARYTPGSGWRPVGSAAWQPLAASPRHTQALAGAGLCGEVTQARRSAEDVRRALATREGTLR